ncbi:endonuclease MutS2 [Impatiens glandulifera]|uniref:endonuclease MutS2 n=1 Tax=Impatiens glandulifera TaxID=253017 RepID=UPI001FB057C7|nr:endonuclease MutS2 [Impatiens glandulifera]
MELCNAFLSIKTRIPHHLHCNFNRFSINSVSSVSLPSSTNLAQTLQADALETLEWFSVCRQLSSFTSTSMGLSAARNSRFPLGRNLEESRKLLNQTTAGLALPQPLNFSGIEDISSIVDSSVSGRLASIGELCAVRRTLRSARQLFEQLTEISSDSKRYLSLTEILDDCDFLIELEQKIAYCIDCKLSIILDRASEDLEFIRFERKSNMENLDSLLKRVSEQIYQAGGIDKPLVTKRRSRMCVGIRASYKSLLPDCVILSTSSSGVTYFVEPKDVVELNNQEVALANSEKVEEKAILSLLTSEIAESNTKIKILLDRLLELDLALARAAHAKWIKGVCPFLHSDSETCRTGDSLLVDIEGIRHPLLLESSMRVSLDSDDDEQSVMETEPSDFPVAIDIKVGCDTKVVVISGPNTGGKTATMKTLGLASIMSKAGMFLPALKHPRLPWFDLVLADIGDHQSLEQSLSTFSGHISQLSKILKVASKESLVLLDEIGSGTDPSEGVALSTSILQYLKDRVNLAVVTTHYADLTRLKEVDNRYENAAMEFSLETLQPTYRIIWGSTGDSNALSIARSIGFDEKIIQNAQNWVSKLVPEKQQKRQNSIYQSLNKEKIKLEDQAQKAASYLSDVLTLFNEIKDEAEDLDKREAALKAKETQKVREEIVAAKRRIEKIVNDFDCRIRAANPEQFGILIKKSESEIASIVEAYCPSDGLLSITEDDNDGSFTPRIGEQVYVKKLGKLATIVEANQDDDDILVQYGKIRVRVNKSNIKPLSNNKTKSKIPLTRSRTKDLNRNLGNQLEGSKSEEAPYGAIVQTSKNTVDLRGMRIEEASHYLDIAISSSAPKSVLFVIHGMGTGVIKERAIEILRKHPRVEKFEQESAVNYGCTVAYIKL